MKRNLAFVLAVAVAGASSNCLALGLGDIKLHSALGEKLEADIPLIGLRGSELNNAAVNLASNPAFQHAKLERADILSHLRFKVMRGAGGKPIVKVTSDQPIDEPFLDFLVVADWSNGRLMREYTVLLNPPQFSSSTRSTALASAGGIAKMPHTAVNHGTVVQVASASTAKSQSERAIPVPAGSYGPIKQGETLGQIARRMRPDDSVSINQMMVAIYRANPDVFMGNINSLKAGYGLKKPDPSVVRALSPAEATSEVRRQNHAWQTGQPLAAATAVRTTPSGDPPQSGADSRGGGRLELVSPGATESGRSITAAADSSPQRDVKNPASGQASAKLRQKAAAARRQAAQVRKRNTSLQGKVDTLKQKLQKAQRLLSVRNRQLASLQQRASQGQSATPSASRKVGAWLLTPLDLGLLIGALLILIVGLLVRRRGQTEAPITLASQPVPEQQTWSAEGCDPLAGNTSRREVPPSEQVEQAGLPAAAEVGRKISVDEQDDFGWALSEDRRERPSLSDSTVGRTPVAAEQSDPIADADFHMTYGLYDQAAALVHKALGSEPRRSDLQLKLLEINFATGDRKAFVAEAIRCRDDLSAQSWEKVLFMGREIAPDEPMFRKDSAVEELAVETTAHTAVVRPVADTGLALEIPDRDAQEHNDTRAATPAEDESIDFDIGSLQLDNSWQAANVSESEDPRDNDRSTEGHADLERAISELSAYVDADAPQAGNEDQPAPGTLSLENADEAVADSGEEETELGATATKLDLARAYLDMGDADGARDILEEVIDEGAPEQQREAEGLIKKIA